MFLSEHVCLSAGQKTSRNARKSKSARPRSLQLSLFLYTVIDSLEWICAAMHVTYMFISGYFHVYHVNPCALCIRVDTVYREQHSYFLSCFSFKIAKNNCTCTYFNLEFCNFFYLIFNNVFFKFIIIKNKKNK